ncbi:threonine/serine dehydratase [Cereibacter sphaeroides]|nr:threonine/serine dehydratase [Cereibacter sphaeroides]
MTDIHLIDAAARRLEGEARRTPLLSSPFLDEIAGRPLFVKAECLQHTGSFKFRGAWNAVSALREAGDVKGVIAFSSGNHAQGVALAAKRQGLPAVIIMPADAPAIKIANTRALGAEVVEFDRATEDRDEIGARLSAERGLALVKPFDMAEVIAGQGTVGLEIAEQAGELGIDSARVLVPCGGGGLTSGIAVALAARAPGFTVHPCEPEDFDDVARSQAAGQRLRNQRLAGSICDAIITPEAGDLTWPLMRDLCGPGQVVTEDEALKAMALAHDRLKIVLEPGGAVALAAALFHAGKLEGDAPLIAVASGGNVDRAMMIRALQA